MQLWARLVLEVLGMENLELHDLSLWTQPLWLVRGSKSGPWFQKQGPVWVKQAVRVLSAETSWGITTFPTLYLSPYFRSLCRLTFGTPNSLVFLLPQCWHFLVSLSTSSFFSDLLMLECLGLRARSALHWHPLTSLLALNSTYIQTTFKCTLLAEVSVLNFRFAYPAVYPTSPLGSLTRHRSNMSSFPPV